jgi:WS/DGAT C-terminal domain
MLPPMGNLTLVVAALSYAEQLNFTAAADADSCPDVEVFTQGVRRTLDALARSVLQPTSLPLDTPAETAQVGARGPAPPPVRLRRAGSDR